MQQSHRKNIKKCYTKILNSSLLLTEVKSIIFRWQQRQNQYDGLIFKFACCSCCPGCDVDVDHGGGGHRGGSGGLCPCFANNSHNAAAAVSATFPFLTAVAGQFHSMISGSGCCPMSCCSGSGSGGGHWGGGGGGEGGGSGSGTSASSTSAAQCGSSRGDSRSDDFLHHSAKATFCTFAVAIINGCWLIAVSIDFVIAIAVTLPLTMLQHCLLSPSLAYVADSVTVLPCHCSSCFTCYLLLPVDCYFAIVVVAFSILLLDFCYHHRHCACCCWCCLMLLVVPQCFQRHCSCHFPLLLLVSYRLIVLSFLCRCFCLCFCCWCLAATALLLHDDLHHVATAVMQWPPVDGCFLFKISLPLRLPPCCCYYCHHVCCLLLLHPLCLECSCWP